MTDATDTLDERLAAYRRLFGTALAGRERTDTGIRFRFHARPGTSELVRDLAAREKACCAFFDFVIEEHGDEVTCDVSVVDDPVARQILDEYYRLPETVDEGAAALHERFAEQGLMVVIDDAGVTRPATDAEIGVPPA
jgi:hypothetical protein